MAIVACLHRRTQRRATAESFFPQASGMASDERAIGSGLLSALSLIDCSLQVSLVDALAIHHADLGGSFNTSTLFAGLVRAVVNTNCACVAVSCYWRITWLAAFCVSCCIIGTETLG